MYLLVEISNDNVELPSDVFKRSRGAQNHTRKPQTISPFKEKLRIKTKTDTFSNASIMEKFELLSPPTKF